MQQISDDRIIQAIRDRGLDPTPDLIERTRQQVQARMATSQTPKAVQSADPTRGVAAYDAFLRSQGAALGRQPKPEEGGGFIDIVQAGGAEGMARMFRTIDFATGMDKEPGGFVEGAQKYFEGVAAAPENQPRAGEEDTFTTNLARHRWRCRWHADRWTCWNGRWHLGCDPWRWCCGVCYGRCRRVRQRLRRGDEVHGR
jgi:hypothetical protein